VIDDLRWYATDRSVARGEQVVKLRRLESLAFGAVYCRSPGHVRPDQLQETLYGDNPRSRSCLSVHICNLNKRIAPLGIRLVGNPGRGYLLEAR
jgi:DNA-binding response OmpR family regulator